MDLHIFDWFQSIGIIILIEVQILQFCPVVTSSRWFLSHFDITLVVVDGFLAIWSEKISQIHFVHFLPRPKSCHFSKTPWFVS